MPKGAREKKSRCVYMSSESLHKKIGGHNKTDF